jgi:transposase
MLLSEGQMSDYKGAALMLDALPKAKELLGDRGYDADWFRQALNERGITACIPSKSNRKKAIEHDRVLYRQRHKIENMFGRLKHWRRIHTVMTDALTPSCQPSALQQPSSSGYDQ